VDVKAHKALKNLKTQNLRDPMREAELIFTALAELSTRGIAQANDARGLQANAEAGKQGGSITSSATCSSGCLYDGLVCGFAGHGMIILQVDDGVQAELLLMDSA
jgi:hypothetical protein